jgi:site-specific recombinase XerD
MMVRYAEVLGQLPPNRSKVKAYRGLSIAEVVALKPEKTLSDARFDDTVSWVPSLFNFAVDSGYIERNPARKLSRPERRSRQDENVIFTQGQLEQLFNGPAHCVAKPVTPINSGYHCLGFTQGAILKSYASW